MKCVRVPRLDNHDTEPGACERCKRLGRECNTPPAKQMGRKRGAVGRYRGLDKAYRKWRAELQKTGSPPLSESAVTWTHEDPDHSSHEDPGHISDHNIWIGLTSNHGGVETGATRCANTCTTSAIGPTTPNEAIPLCQINVEDGDDVLDQRKLNNPLALLADASKSAQSVELVYSADSRVQESITVNIAPRLLSRPGYISLGLQLDRTTLERGLETIFESPKSQELLNAQYFKPIY